LFLRHLADAVLKAAQSGLFLFGGVMKFDVRDNIDEVLRAVSERERSIPVATSNALNTAAFKVREIEIEEMKRVFDRPTRFTLNAFFVARASRDQLMARVYLKESWFGKHYLRPNIYGGPRVPKGFEIQMRKAGLLPEGMFAVPGRAAKLDSSGNMSRGQLLQVMSALQLAERTAGYSANRTVRSRKRNSRRAEYFVGRPGGGRLPLGVWQVSYKGRLSTGPVLIFVRQPTYQARFKFEEVASRTASKAFPLYLERELRGIPTGLSLGR
jgi:hypothetical protein